MNACSILHGKSARILPLLITALSATHAQVELTIDANQKIRDFRKTPIGINVNYLMDDDAYLKPKKSTANALKNMGVKFLRYPGGEKADNYLWSVAPWNGPNPHFARTGTEDWPSNDPRFAEGDRYKAKSTVLDFDEFMALCRAVDAEPVLVVSFDGMYKAASTDGTAPSKQLLMQTAVEWVRYANVTKGYSVKYWEIGNESYHRGSYNGIAPNATIYANDLSEFAQAMKAVDPSIKIGANGNGQWWNTLLSTAGDAIDFLAVHTYPTSDYSGYNRYRDNSPNFAAEVNSAISAIGHKDKLVALTEFNAIYWGSEAGWRNTNDIGHALAVFDMTMQNILKDKVEFALLWNTRWVDNAHKPFEVNDALDKNGNLNPTGTALAFLAKNLLSRAVSVSGSTNQVRAWASMNTDGDTLNVFILNKGPGIATIDLQVQGMSYKSGILRSRFSGTGPNDTLPKFSTGLDSSIQNDALSVPANSISVLSYLKTTGTAGILKHANIPAQASDSRRTVTDRYDILGHRIGKATMHLKVNGVYIEKDLHGALRKVIDGYHTLPEQ